MKAAAGCLNLHGFSEEGSMILPVLERIRGRETVCEGGTVLAFEMGAGAVGETSSWAAVT